VLSTRIDHTPKCCGFKGETRILHFGECRFHGSPRSKEFALAGLPDTSPTHRTLAVQIFFGMVNEAMELRHLRYLVAVAKALNFMVNGVLGVFARSGSGVKG